MKAAIFDIDGTLVDSVDFHAQAWQQAFSHFGYDFKFDKIRSQIGKGGDQLMPHFLSEEDVDAKGKEMEKYRGDVFKKSYLPRVKAFPKVRDLFIRLIDEGWTLALASSAKKDELGDYKEIARITDLIETETSSDDAEESKPQPDIFEAAIRRLGDISPEDCVVIGDSPYDAEAAKKAGIKSVGFLCGGFKGEELLKAGYIALYRDASDLLGAFEKSIFSKHRSGASAKRE